MKQSRFTRDPLLDCFASLAMTGIFGGSAPARVKSTVLGNIDPGPPCGSDGGERHHSGRSGRTRKLREYGVDGLRFDDTIDIRTELLREINSSYRNTDPRQPG